MASTESAFQKKFLDRIRREFPDCVILKNDPNYIQGIPDWIVLYDNKWIALEMKRSISSPKRPNQEYYIDRLDGMSYAAFVYPENADDILDEIRFIFTY